jgi:hypothetical protein
MPQQYDNTNRWTLFRNDRKERDTHPDHTGTLNVDGVEYFLNAWVKEGAKGCSHLEGAALDRSASRSFNLFPKNDGRERPLSHQRGASSPIGYCPGTPGARVAAWSSARGARSFAGVTHGRPHSC